MRRKTGASRRAMPSQWNALVDHHSETAQIEVIAAAKGCPDMRFTANAGLVADEQVIPARFRMPERRLHYYPPAFDDRSRRVIEERVPKERRIAVSEQDALGFACNVMRIEDRLFLNQASPDLCRALSDWGYETLVCPVSECLKAGGVVKCLSLILDQPSYSRLPVSRSSIASADIEVKGHLLDAGELNQTLDTITEAGGSFRLAHLSLGERKDQESRAGLRIIAPTQTELEFILERLSHEHLP